MKNSCLLIAIFSSLLWLDSVDSYAGDAGFHAGSELYDPYGRLPSDRLYFGMTAPDADRPYPLVSAEQFFDGSGLSTANERSATAFQPVQIPEPMLFDMVRPLGPNRGDFEFNTLAIFPWKAQTNRPGDDPFGPGPTTPDRGQIEWAPEVEIALSDRFAIEFELPFEGGKLEELKVGLQWTFGTAFGNRYIHGAQVLVEPTPQFETWNATLLYIGGVRFDETWSALVMFGTRMDLEGPNNIDTFERLFNASLFADINEWLTVGLETNTAIRADGTSNFILVPQAHIELTDCLEIQSGIGLGAANEGYEMSAIVRVIYAP